MAVDLTGIAPRLDADHADRRATLAAAQLLGVAIARNIMHVSPLAEADLDALTALFAPAIQATLAPHTTGADPSLS